MHALLAPFEPEFMRRALLEAVLAGLVCGVLGVPVLLRGLAYTGESLSHVLLPGAAIALIAGAPVVGGAVLVAVPAAVVIALIGRRADVGEDAAVGVVFTAAFAAGVALLAVAGAPKELDSLLFGSILAVSPVDLALAALAGAVVVAGLGTGARRLVLVAFDRPYAEALGLRTGLLDVALLVALALAAAVALQGVGALLFLALLIAPAAAARVLSRRVWTMLWLAPAIGVGSGVIGLELSYRADLAAGPAIALVALTVFVAALLVDELRSVLRRQPLSG